MPPPSVSPPEWATELFRALEGLSDRIGKLETNAEQLFGRLSGRQDDVDELCQTLGFTE